MKNLKQSPFKKKQKINKASQAYKNNFGKRFEQDIIFKVGEVEKLSELVPIYALGLVVATRWKSANKLEFIDWLKVNNAISSKFGIESAEALKVFARKIFDRYGLGEESEKAEKVETIVGSLLRDFTEKNG